MIRGLAGGSENICVKVYAIGGVYDPDPSPKRDEISQDISESLIRCMRRSRSRFNIELWCCCELNTLKTQQGISAVVQGMCWDRRGELAFRAEFEDRGPEEILRAAADFFPRDNESLYNSNQFQITIQPFENTLEVYKDTKYLYKTNEDITEVRFFCKHCFLSLLFLVLR